MGEGNKRERVGKPDRGAGRTQGWTGRQEEQANYAVEHYTAVKKIQIPRAKGNLVDMA